MNSLRRYRLFVTLLVIPVLAIVLVVVLIVTVFGGTPSQTVADQPTNGTTTPTTVPLPGASPVGLPSPAVQLPTIAVLPTQTPEPEPTPAIPTETPTPTVTIEPTATPTPEGPIQYEVQPDDTLFSIAGAFDVDPADIISFNNLPDENFIFVGQILEIPTNSDQLLTPRESTSGEPFTGTVLATDGLNVRDKPSTTDSTVQYVAAGGSTLELTGVTEIAEGVTWYEVEDGNWVNGDYIDTTGTPITDEVTPTAAPTAEGTAEPTATPADGAPVTGTVVPAAGVNIRTEPRSDGGVLRVAPGGSTVEMTGETQVVDGVTWWKTTDNGWVQGQYLKFG